MKINLDPLDGDLESYEKQCERTKENLISYDIQFGKGYPVGIQSTIEYAAELISHARSEVRYWKSMVMEEVMENRRKRKTISTKTNILENHNPHPPEGTVRPKPSPTPPKKN